MIINGIQNIIIAKIDHLFLKHKFKRGRGNNYTYESVDKFAFIAAVSLISNISDINEPTKRNMVNILKIHECD